jgi:DNA recombination protein RmuC
MDIGMVIVGGLAAACAGACVWLLVGRGRLQADAAGAVARAAGAEAERARMAAELGAAQAKVEEAGGRNQSLSGKVLLLEQQLDDAVQRHQAELKQAQLILAEQIKALEQRERDLRERYAAQDARASETFKGLAADALKSSSAEFLKLAKESLAVEQERVKGEMEKGKLAVDSLVRPITETLKKTDEKLALLGKEWSSDRASLVEQIKGMSAAGDALRGETMKLSKALSRPEVRGRYGELQLRRVAELAGMVSYCDFTEQASQRDGEGRLLRPDMVVRLPNERMIAVDAKCNTFAYMEAVEAQTPELREECLERFARHMGEQVTALSKKGYWAELEGSPDFVVMFVPGDQFLDAALSRRQDLLEKASEQNVILASPSTLIGLLRAVAVGWREKQVTEAARELAELGRKVRDQAATAFEHVAGLGSALTQAVNRYNKFVGSYEGRLEPALREFEKNGIKVTKELPEVLPVEAVVRQVEAKPEIVEVTTAS